MKKRFFALLLGILMVLVLLPTTALAANWTYDPNTQTLTNDTITLSNVTASETKLTIGVQTDTISGALDLRGEIMRTDGTTRYTIAAIGGGAFASQPSLLPLSCQRGLRK